MKFNIRPAIYSFACLAIISLLVLSSAEYLLTILMYAMAGFVGFQALSQIYNFGRLHQSPCPFPSIWIILPIASLLLIIVAMCSPLWIEKMANSEDARKTIPFIIIGIAAVCGAIVQLITIAYMIKVNHKIEKEQARPEDNTFEPQVQESSEDTPTIDTTEE